MLTKASTWIVSPKWDIFWMFSAFWLSLVLVMINFVYPLNQLAVLGAVLVTGRFLGLGHSWSTTYMVLWSPLFKEARAQHRKRYFYWPIGIAFVCFLLGYQISQTQVFDKEMSLGWEHWSWVVYISLFWVGHFWHFGNQDFGVLSFYRSRAQDGRPESRQWDRRYASIMMFIIQPLVFLSIFGEFGNAFSHIGFRLLPFSNFMTADLGLNIALLSIPLSLYVLYRDLKSPESSIGHFMYLLLMATHPFMLFLIAGHFGMFYTVTYIWSHWTIAIGLVSFINSNHLRGQGARRPMLKHFALVAAVVLPVFAITYKYLAWDLFGRDAQTAANQIAQTTYSNHLLIGFFLGFFLFEQLLHYYCDRILFRFRLPEVQKNIVPLLRS